MSFCKHVHSFIHSFIHFFKINNDKTHCCDNRDMPSKMQSKYDMKSCNRLLNVYTNMTANNQKQMVFLPCILPGVASQGSQSSRGA